MSYVISLIRVHVYILWDVYVSVCVRVCELVKGNKLSERLADNNTTTMWYTVVVSPSTSGRQVNRGSFIIC